jgi:hypothetical protein
MPKLGETALIECPSCDRVAMTWSRTVSADPAPDRAVLGSAETVESWRCLRCGFEPSAHFQAEAQLPTFEELQRGLEGLQVSSAAEDVWNVRVSRIATSRDDAIVISFQLTGPGEPQSGEVVVDIYGRTSDDVKTLVEKVARDIVLGELQPGTHRHFED